MKVLLAWRAPDDDPDLTSPRVLPPGLPWLAASLREAGHDATVVNFSRLSWKAVQNFLTAQAPHVVGVSCMTSNRGVALRLCRVARRCQPQAKIVLGGPHASALGPAILARVREIDAIVLGEGERTLVDLCARLAVDPASPILGAAGLLVRGESPSPAALPDVDGLARPVRGLQGAGIVPERDLVHVVAARQRPQGAAVRAPAGVAAELRELRDEFGVVDVSLVGPSLLRETAWLGGLAETLLASGTHLRFTLTGDLAALSPAARDEALEASLLLAFRAGCRGVRLELTTEEALTADRVALSEASRVLHAAGLPPHVTLRLVPTDAEPGTVLEALRGALRALRPATGLVEADELLPATPAWDELVAEREMDETFWFEDERGAIPLLAPGAVERLRSSLEPVLRDLARSVKPGPRDLDALEARAPCAATHLLWGDFRAAHGDRDEAERRYREAGALEPANPFPWIALATLFRRPKGDKGREAAALEQVLRRVPRHAEARERLDRMRPTPRRRRRES
jgi:hypothetical protein